MDADTDDIAYAKTQIKEARRRLESVRDRVTEVQKEQVVGAIDEMTDEVIFGLGIDDVPEEDRRMVKITKETNEVTDIEGHIQNIIIDCQMSIELSVKAMFKAVGQDFDYSHGVGFGSHNTQGFNNKVPADYPRKQDLIRSIFLTQLWESFYQLAKYGAPELNVGPDIIFSINDGERALNDAEFCVDLAEDFIDYIEG
ncbi:hypothetical protein [Halapricum desulfuricans]|uniref:hypothetical protein n=1 Tax=Halapricum desulfuricans TaxID=2841257 RepID=UPI001E3C2BA1|nr:hypothetical protein [Halapricum desulfuricans]